MPTNEESALVITSTYKLKDTEIKEIKKSLGIGQPDVNVLNEVDEGIIAGLIIKYNGYYLDLSLKNKLAEITERIS